MKVLEAYTRDVGRGIIRLETDTLQEAGLSVGDFALIAGKATTAGKCMPMYPSDPYHGKRFARLDGLIRLNAGAAVGEYISIAKAKVSSAQSISISPVGERAEIIDYFVSQWKEPIESAFAAEALSGLPVSSGDFVSIEYREHEVGTFYFVVLEKEPAEGISIVEAGTKIDLVPQIVA
ncbi:MAG TPA: hypothetical protein VEJ36_05205 [Nitrososphaerales archaeon]|nr:hypothetical protein [Nitrososphaerales archaeon]